MLWMFWISRPPKQESENENSALSDWAILPVAHSCKSCTLINLSKNMDLSYPSLRPLRWDPPAPGSLRWHHRFSCRRRCRTPPACQVDWWPSHWKRINLESSSCRCLPIAFEDPKRSKYVTQTKGYIHAYMIIHTREISEGFIFHIIHTVVFLY